MRVTGQLSYLQSIQQDLGNSWRKLVMHRAAPRELWCSRTRLVPAKTPCPTATRQHPSETVMSRDYTYMDFPYEIPVCQARQTREDATFRDIPGHAGQSRSEHVFADHRLEKQMPWGRRLLSLHQYKQCCFAGVHAWNNHVIRQVRHPVTVICAAAPCTNTHSASLHFS